MRGTFERCWPSSLYLFILLSFKSCYLFYSSKGGEEISKDAHPAPWTNSCVQPWWATVKWFDFNLTCLEEIHKVIVSQPFTCFSEKKGFFFFFGNEMKITFTQFSGGRFWYVEHNITDQSQCHTYQMKCFRFWKKSVPLINSSMFTSLEI